MNCCSPLKLKNRRNNVYQEKRAKMSNIKQKREIVNTYILLIKEYIDVIQKSNVMTELNYPCHFLYIGIHSIHRVFEHILTRTKNISRSYFYAQKAYFYYLEYIEQLHKSNITINLNHIDIVLFVYKKTIFNTEQENPENMMIFDEKELIHIDNHEISDMCGRMIKIVNVLMYWENIKMTFEKRKDIFDLYLTYYLTHNEIIDLTNLTIIQEKLRISDDIYCQILQETMVKNAALKSSKKKTLTEVEKGEYILSKFYTGDRTFLDKFEATSNIPEFVKWLYT